MAMTSSRRPTRWCIRRPRRHWPAKPSSSERTRPAPMLKRNVGARAQVLIAALTACMGPDAHAQAGAGKPAIAVFSGPTATIQNNTPLITSNKARQQYGLPLRKDPWGQVFVDQLRYQRLAARVTVYIEMFSAHPLESDVKELYAAPDGYVNAKGDFSK